MTGRSLLDACAAISRKPYLTTRANPDLMGPRDALETHSYETAIGTPEECQGGASAYNTHHGTAIRRR